MSPPSKAINRSDILRVATSPSNRSDDKDHNKSGQGTAYHQAVPIDAVIDQPSNTTPVVAYTGGQVLVTAPVTIDQEIGPTLVRYFFAIEALEGVPDIELLLAFAWDAYNRQEYWQASVSAIAVLFKILKSVNIAVKFTMDTTQSNTPGLGTLIQPSHVQEACASLAVHAPTGPTTVNMFTISTISRVASNVTHGAVIASPTGAGTAPHTGPYYTNSTTPSYTVHAVYTWGPFSRALRPQALDSFGNWLRYALHMMAEFSSRSFIDRDYVPPYGQFPYLLVIRSLLHGLIIAAEGRMLETMHLIHSLCKLCFDDVAYLKLIVTIDLKLPFLLGPTAPPNDLVCTVAIT
jgi:hypothetical protein